MLHPGGTLGVSRPQGLRQYGAIPSVTLSTIQIGREEDGGVQAGPLSFSTLRLIYTLKKVHLLQGCA